MQTASKIATDNLLVALGKWESGVSPCKFTGKHELMPVAEVELTITSGLGTGCSLFEHAYVNGNVFQVPQS